MSTTLRRRLILDDDFQLGGTNTNDVNGHFGVFLRPHYLNYQFHLQC